MSLQSLYNNISEQNTFREVTNDLPPIAKTDIKQYTNILAKKSHLNEDKSLFTENLQQQAAAPVRAVAANNSPRPTTSISNVLQSVQKKYNNSTVQEKSIIERVLNSLT